MAKSVKRVLLGNGPLGAIGANLYADPKEAGGSFNSREEKTSRPALYVGMDDVWPGVLETLLHEAFEASATLRGLRYKSEDYAGTEGSVGTTFVMTHDQFTQVMKEVAGFSALAIPKVASLHRKLFPKGRK